MDAQLSEPQMHSQMITQLKKCFISSHHC